VSLLLSLLGDLGVLLVSLALFVLPGWALLTYLLSDRRLAWGEKLGLSASLSLCVYPLVLLWARVAGVQPGPLAAWGPVTVASIALAWRYRRYPQLAGQVVLPLAIWLTWELAEVGDAKKAWNMLLLTGVALAGMFLYYYRMPFYYAAFVIAWVLACGLPRWWLDWRSWGRWVTQLTMSGLVMLTLILPWLVHIASSSLATGVEAGVATGSTLERVLQEYEAWRDIVIYVPKAFMVLAVIGLIWGAIQRRGEVLAIALWVPGLVSLVAARLLRLPGTNYMQSFAIMIGLYIPVGLLGGYAIDFMLDSVGQSVKTWRRVFVTGVLIAVAVWSARDRSAVVSPAYRMVAPADLVAMDWIRANTPADARFLVDGFAIYNRTSIVGSDAGWWIPLLAGRQNTIPPQYALVNEQPYQPGYDRAMTDLVLKLRQVGATSPAGIRLLCQYGITHVYVGQGQGRIAIPPPEPMLPIADLEASPHFMELYRQDKVGVFSFDTQECSRGNTTHGVGYTQTDGSLGFRVVRP